MSGLSAENDAPLAIAADIDAELQDLQSFLLVETGHMPTVNAVASLRSRVAKALGHSDPYCVAHCKPGIKHSQCGCRCGQHRRASTRVTSPAERDCNGYALGSSCGCESAADCPASSSVIPPAEGGGA